mmetsp:Transcript_54835/g.178165  ORF Transcript_54835/g.178165 Transcript_54835/m.178165 type:complete len:145 (-) Transcript_54835:601-1035(-)
MAVKILGGTAMQDVQASRCDYIVKVTDRQVTMQSRKGPEVTEKYSSGWKATAPTGALSRARTATSSSSRRCSCSRRIVSCSRCSRCSISGLGGCCNRGKCSSSRGSRRCTSRIARFGGSSLAQRLQEQTSYGLKQVGLQAKNCM